MEKASFNNCVSSEEIYDIIDGEAAEKTCKDFYEHIKSCEKCRKEYESIKTLKTAMASCTSIPSGDFAANTLKRLKKTERNPFIRVINTPSFRAISATAACLALVFAILGTSILPSLNPETTVNEASGDGTSVIAIDEYSLDHEKNNVGNEPSDFDNNIQSGYSKTSDNVESENVNSEPRNSPPSQNGDLSDDYSEHSNTQNSANEEPSTETPDPSLPENLFIINPCTNDESNLITVSTEDAKIARKSFEFCVDSGIYQQLPYGEGYYFFNNEERGTQTICWIQDGIYYKISVPLSMCQSGEDFERLLSNI